MPPNISTWLAHTAEHQFAEREVTGSNPGHTNTRGLKITEDEGVPFAMTSANG